MTTTQDQDRESHQLLKGGKVIMTGTEERCEYYKDMAADGAECEVVEVK
jgi:hypothetical protein